MVAFLYLALAIDYPIMMNGNVCVLDGNFNETKA